MIGPVTAAAIFFTVCQAAASGTRWAQVTLLLVGITFATFLAFAILFTGGLFAFAVPPYTPCFEMALLHLGGWPLMQF